MKGKRSLKGRISLFRTSFLFFQQYRQNASHKVYHTREIQVSEWLWFISRVSTTLQDSKHYLTASQIRSRSGSFTYRCELATKASVWSLRQKALRNSIHSPKTRESTVMALPRSSCRRTLSFQRPRIHFLQYQSRRRQNAPNTKPITLGSLRFG